MPAPERRPRVLLLDDSATLRSALKLALSKEGVDVVGETGDPYRARDLIFGLSPDLLILDLQMPDMDGLSFLARLMAHHPMPVIVLSSLTRLNRPLEAEARALGALDVFPKPAAAEAKSEIKRLAALIKASLQGPAQKSGQVIALGASTGGTDALASLIGALPKSSPPILIVQHMPEGFTETFAGRLNRSGQLRVRQAENGDRLESGLALLAPGGRHMTLEKEPSGSLRVRCGPGRPVNHVMPSVDVLFYSMVALGAKNFIAALLSGMGKDGAQGLLALRQAGAHTLAQDEASSVVWGMPGEAVRLKAAESILPLHDMPQALLK